MGDLYPVMKIENGLFQKSSKVYENTCQLFFLHQQSTFFTIQSRLAHIP